MKRGKTLRKLRRELDLTQENIAFEIGISQKQVSRIENGKAEPRIELLKKWCAVLGITIGDLEKNSDEED